MKPVDEKANTLSRCGSFYYRTLVDTAKADAEFVSHTSWQTRSFAQLQQVTDTVLGNAYQNDFYKDIFFTDADINWYGTKAGLQLRSPSYIPNAGDVVGSTLTVFDVGWLDVDRSVSTSNWRLGKEDLPEVGSSFSQIMLRTISTVMIESAGYLSIWQLGTATPTLLASSKARATVVIDGVTTWEFDPFTITEDHVSGAKTLGFQLGHNIETSWRGDDRFPSTQNRLVASVTKSYKSTNSNISTLDGIMNYIPAIRFVQRTVPLHEGAEIDIVNRYDSIPIEEEAAALQTASDAIVATEDSSVLIVPAADAADSIVLPDTAELRWTLTVDPDILVTSIRKKDGTMLYMNQDYIAEYGKLTFLENPISMFPDMKLHAHSYTRRVPNVFNYMLHLDDVYGPVDKVLKYYRASQTPESFYKAACQAAGLAIVDKTCVVLDVYPLHKGCAYITTEGRIDVPYIHTHLKVGDTINAGTGIGVQDLFKLVMPGQGLPSGVTALNLDTALPVPGLTAPDSAIAITNGYGAYCPAYTGTPEAMAAWASYILKVNGNDVPPEGTEHTYTATEDLSTAINTAGALYDYQEGEPFAFTSLVAGYTGTTGQTNALLELAPNYYLITQGGSHVGLSSSPTAMLNAAGVDAGWAELSYSEELEDVVTHTYDSTTRVYGWISRDATGATGVDSAMPIPFMSVNMAFKYMDGHYTTVLTLANSRNKLILNTIIRDDAILNMYNCTPGEVVSILARSVSVTDNMSAPTYANALEHFRNVACAGRCIVACINEGVMSADMKLRLLRFIKRELPVGSVLTTADMSAIISNEESIDV